MQTPRASQADADRAPLPISQHWTLTAIKGTALILAVASLVLFMGRLVPLASSWAAWPWLCIGAVVGYGFADLMTGSVHWFCDSFFAPDTPLIGRLVIHPFRDHHDHPEAITRYRFLQQDSTNYMLMIPLLVYGWSRGTPDPASPGSIFPYGILLGLALGALGTNVFHKWAHAEQVPPVVRALQRLGLILSPEAHDRHHRAYTHGYCVTNGWMNRLLDPVDFFGRSERLIRRMIRRPRPDHG